VLDGKVPFKNEVNVLCTYLCSFNNRRHVIAVLTFHNNYIHLNGFTAPCISSCGRTCQRLTADFFYPTNIIPYYSVIAGRFKGPESTSENYFPRNSKCLGICERGHFIQHSSMFGYGILSRSIKTMHLSTKPPTNSLHGKQTFLRS